MDRILDLDARSKRMSTILGDLDRLEHLTTDHEDTDLETDKQINQLLTEWSSLHQQLLTKS